MMTIYIRLSNEGTDVFRPTPAEELAGGLFRVLSAPSYDPEDETREFPTRHARSMRATGTFNGEKVLVAVKERLVGRVERRETHRLFQSQYSKNFEPILRHKTGS